jgi:hypothetical protein
MDRSDVLDFIEKLNTFTEYDEKLDYFDSMDDVLDYVVMIDAQELIEEIASAFEVHKKKTYILELFKSRSKRRKDEQKADRVGRFSAVDAKTLDGKNGAIAWTHDNFRRIMEKAHEIRFAFDTFTRTVFITQFPWEANGEVFEAPLYNDTLKLQTWKDTYNQQKFKEALNQGPFPLIDDFSGLKDKVEAIAQDTEKFDLAQKWLLSHKDLWKPGDPDLINDPENNWLSILYNIRDKKWAATVGRIWLLSIVAKILQPGYPTRNYFVLEGEQEIGKSTLCKKLCPEIWYSEEMLHRDTDTIELSRRNADKIIIEFPELGGKDKITNNTWKKITVQTKNKFRKMRVDDTSEIASRNVHVITTNEHQFLSDPTGETRPLVIRFENKEREWPDWTIFDEIHPRLLAQAIHMFTVEQRTPYLEIEERETQRQQNERREIVTKEQEWVEAYLEFNKDEFNFGVRIDEIIPWLRENCNSSMVDSNNEFPKFLLPDNFERHESKMETALIKLGYEKKQKKIDGKNRRRWLKKE